MAIKNDFLKTISNENQITIKNAYWKIMNLEGDKEQIHVNVEVRESQNSDATIGLLSLTFTPAMTNKNYHQQAYEFLKTLPDFENCADC